MKPYVIALAVGLVVGMLYGALNVRSPAPPVIALVGLLGMLVGEQVVPIVKQLASGQHASLAAIAAGCTEHVFGSLPRRPDALQPTDAPQPRLSDVPGPHDAGECLSPAGDQHSTL